ncbi:uncharacterized protein LOC131536700 isoform X2 [Onychostoma macrolepis]|uniref:uncharacterized protein LOC131536700 isoform X2 n=1 Tax=Onychostoma macrolepis TaxID=369639 RepID=UPI00272C4C2F|nr:uncharacterized protein LOC131536700 isoform X2 [Onychostoma macrolepis]XP_058625739.1 uncharacterized protein LOC131536700 isoform X2 [Onychostoma macrolepis]XP_058625740.1 uncharacterized protein LOC131536700 isoform X2 [Onychostoma macrolepis]
MEKALGETRSTDNSRHKKKKEKKKNLNLLKVISWNINGLKEKLKDTKKTNQLLTILGDYDIVLLQEIHLGKKRLGKKEKKSEDNTIKYYLLDSDSDSENQDEEAYTTKVINLFRTKGYDVEQLQDRTCQDLGGSEKKIYMTNFCSNSRGVAILVNKRHTCLKTFCEDGDYAWVYVEIGDQRYTFVSAYYHPKEKSNLMMRILCSFLTQGSKAFKRPVIGGDFNTTLNYRLDKASTKDSAEHKSRRKSIREIMKTVNLIDVWRSKNPDKKDYTYACKKPMSRLDYVFMLEKDLHCVENCDIWKDEDMVPELSDHYPMKLTLTI